jgi:hypothetical protein
MISLIIIVIIFIIVLSLLSNKHLKEFLDYRDIKQDNNKKTDKIKSNDCKYLNKDVEDLILKGNKYYIICSNVKDKQTKKFKFNFKKAEEYYNEAINQGSLQAWKKLADLNLPISYRKYNHYIAFYNSFRQDYLD